MLAVVSRNLQKVKLHRVPQEKAWENVFMLVCCFSAPKDMLVLQSVFSPGLDMFRHVTSLFMRPATTFLPRPWYLEDAVEPPSGLAAGQPAPIQV